jgi:hypothetical protein
VLELLLDQERGDTNIQITEAVLVAAANNLDGCKMMKILLEREGSEIEITEAVITVATKGSDKGIEVWRLLMDWSGNTGHVTEAVLKEKETWHIAHS